VVAAAFCFAVSFCNQAIAQACAFASPGDGMMSAIAMLRQFTVYHLATHPVCGY